VPEERDTRQAWIAGISIGLAFVSLTAWSGARWALAAGPACARRRADAVRADLRRTAPDLVALLQRGHTEFGVGPFGEDLSNGRGIVTWVHDEYEFIDRIGPQPLRGRGFGAKTWRAKDAPAARPLEPR